jgi:8-oxo-dGTP diphosphatase
MCGGRIDLVVPGRCSHCGAAHYRNARPTAGGLVVRGDEVMLLRRAIDPWLGHWDIPGGFCDGAELPEDTVRRELREETGLDVTIVTLLGMWLDHYELAGTSFDTLNSYYLLDGGSDPRPVLDEAENSEVGWFTVDRVPDDIAFPSHQRDVIAAWQGWVRDAAS